MRNKMDFQKIFSVSILLWMKSDRPRNEGMDYWKGPHAKIIASSPQLLEYRQLHLSETEHGFWPSADGVKTGISEDRRPDGIAEVSYQKTSSPLRGTAQTSLAFKDEVNIFRRTLMHMGMPWSSRWYRLDNPRATALRDVVFFQRRPGVSGRDFRRVLGGEFAAGVRASQGLTEFRSQVYLPWHRLSWNTPNVAHDNPRENRLHASCILGFESREARERFYAQEAPKLNGILASRVSGVLAQRIDQTLVFAADGVRLDRPV